MPELRWILLGLGVLFWIGLWWWETRRQHQASGSEHRRLPDRLVEPTFAPPPEPMPEPPPAEAPPEPASEPMIDPGDTIPVLTEALARIEPILGDTEIVRPEPRRIEPPEEKIITLRLAAPPLERFEGRQLVEALQGAGLHHGKFSIFHRTTAEGATVFSVASLVEPGTFDLERIDGRRFPGVTLFAVLPGPLDAAALVEEMIGAGKHLAEKLHGVLQDERGAALNVQRLSDLRADVAAWQARTQSAGPPPG
ncbi:MAG TPA: cell division protein ZipA C-terminal FtsZ-binding domain-containing protein [Steroidobacteraceae bacterium]|jgi:cell division protein ZipA|nr:cell division protein ZipA C-terminal FtsZ-binding domain-containing protein [Steroidobacteraceae bacterium]